MSEEKRLHEKLREHASNQQPNNPHWIDTAKTLLEWAADALEAADKALNEKSGGEK